MDAAHDSRKHSAASITVEPQPSGRLSIEVSAEPLTQAFCLEIQPLLIEHWREIAHYKDIPLRPAWERYATLYAADQLLIITGRRLSDQTIAGYAIYFVAYSLHYSTSLNATQDIIYVAREYRGTRLALRLLREGERALRKRGVQVLQYRGKLSHPELGRLVQLMGAEPVDQVFCKRLDRA